MQAVIDAHEVWNRRASTSALNRWLEGVTAAHPPPAVSGRRIRLDYVTQPKSRPPTFVLFASRADKVPDALQALSRQQPARDVRPAGNADPPDAAREGEPLCRQAQESSGEARLA